MSFKGKRILITAGPTWVPIDRVRVISNIASGITGILLAEEFICLGAKVTLLLGPVPACCLNKNMKVVRFRFFDELKESLIKELKTKKYDIVIHSAAVSDYKVGNKFIGKVKSDKSLWKLNLVPTEKIIDLVKKIDDKVFLVGFKFDPNITKNKLLNEAQGLLRRSGADLVVANTMSGAGYRAYLVSESGIGAEINSKEKLVENLASNLKLMKGVSV